MSHIYRFPSGDPYDPEMIVVDLDFWAEQEKVINEVAITNKAKAPYLMAHFNRCCLDLDRLANRLELSCQVAVRHAEKIRARIILDDMPRILAEKKLSTSRSPLGSDDVREAVLSQDPEYDQALDQADLLRSMVKLMHGKFDAFERAFRAIRTLAGEQNFSLSTKNPNLSGDTGSSAPGEETVSLKFGSPKFGRP